MFRQRAQGFTLIEVLVALAVASGALLLGLSLLWQQPRVLERLQAQRRALRALEAGLETVRVSAAPLTDGPLLPLTGPLPGSEGMTITIEVEPTLTPGLYDVTLVAGWELQHQQWQRSLHTRVWRP